MKPIDPMAETVQSLNQIQQALAVASTLLLPLTANNSANAAPNAYSTPPTMQQPGHDHNQPCSFEKDPITVEGDQAGPEGISVCSNQKGLWEKQTTYVEIFDHKPNGKVSILRNHGEDYYNKQHATKDGSYRVAKDMYPTKYLLRLINRGDKLIAFVSYKFDDPTSQSSGDSYPFSKRITHKALKPKPTDSPPHQHQSSSQALAA